MKRRSKPGRRKRVKGGRKKTKGRKKGKGSQVLFWTRPDLISGRFQPAPASTSHPRLNIICLGAGTLKGPEAICAGPLIRPPTTPHLLPPHQSLGSRTSQPSGMSRPCQKSISTSSRGLHPVAFATPSTRLSITRPFCCSDTVP